jgi:hypothetical protein
LIRAYRGTSLLLDEQPGDEKGLVPNRRSAETDARATREKPVLRIDFTQVRAEARVLPIGATGDDQFLHGRHIPARPHEFGGEPVQQLGMTRRFALHPEVLGRLYEAGSEVFLPVAIHSDPGGQGMRW